LKNNVLFVIGGSNVLSNLCPGFFHIVKDARVFAWRSLVSLDRGLKFEAVFFDFGMKGGP